MRKHIINRSTFLYFTIVLICASLGHISFQLYTSYQESQIVKYLNQQNEFLAQRIQEKIYFNTSVLSTMETLLKLSKYDPNSFSEWKESILGSSKDLMAIQLAPDGIVSYCYPLEGNEKAIGHDLLKDSKRKKGAMLGIKNRKLTFIGPVKLIQNNLEAIIIRKPIFKEDTFWGFAVSLLSLDKVILKSDFASLKKNNLYFKISGFNPDLKKKPVIYEYNPHKKNFQTSYKILVPNGYWNLELGYNQSSSWKTKVIYYLVIFFSFLISLYISYIHYREKRNLMRLSELEKKNTALALGVTASHEINQPLTSIRGYIDLIKLILENNNIDQKLYKNYYIKIDKSFAEIKLILKKLTSFNKFEKKQYSKNVDMLILSEEHDSLITGDKALSKHKKQK